MRLADQPLAVATLEVGGRAGKLVEAWELGIDHCIAILRAPDYVPFEDLKRDRLMYEMTYGFGQQMLRIGEGLIQREKTDRLASLLENLKKPDKKE